MEKKYYDRRGTIREYIYREYYPDDSEYEEISYYDCEGKEIYFQSTDYDDDGCEIECIDIAYKNGNPVAYWRNVDDWDADFREFYNPETDEFEYVTSENEEYANYYWDHGVANADEPCDDFPYNDLFFGPSLISEDSYNRFSTIGVEVRYTKYLCPHFGLTGDAGLTFGSQNSVDYTKLNLLAGVTYEPFNNASVKKPFTLNFDALAGIASVTGKYNQTKSTSTDFAGEIGVNGIYDFTKNWGIEAGAAWNPVFGSGSTSNNYRFRLDANLKF